MLDRGEVGGTEEPAQLRQRQQDVELRLRRAVIVVELGEEEGEDGHQVVGEVLLDGVRVSGPPRTEHLVRPRAVTQRTDDPVPGHNNRN